MFEPSRLKSILESLIFASESPLKVTEMLKALHSFSENSPTQTEELPESPEEILELQKDEVPELETEGHDAKDQLLAYAQNQGSDEAAAPLENENQTPLPAVSLSASEIHQALSELQQHYLENTDRGIALIEVAGGWQFRTKSENAAYLRYFFQPKPIKLSKPSLETLSIVAYRQPMTRVEIDAIRGVDSGGVLKNLLDKNLIRIVGKKEEPGKPVLYGTTSDFLELFQLKNLKELPTLRDYADLEDELRQQSEKTGLIVSNKNSDSRSSDEEETLSARVSSISLEALTPEEELLLNELDDSLGELKKIETEIFDVPAPKNAMSAS